METLIVTSKRVFKLDDKGQLTNEPLVDKNGKPYCVLEFATPDTSYKRNSKGVMTAIKRPQVFVGGYSAWKESNLQSQKGRPDFGWDLEEGEEVQGTIRKVSVEPYEITQKDGSKKMVSSLSVVSFVDSDNKDELELDIAVQVRRKGRVLASQTQQQTDFLNKEGITDPTAGTAKIDAQAEKAK